MIRNPQSRDSGIERNNEAKNSARYFIASRVIQAASIVFSAG